MMALDGAGAPSAPGPVAMATAIDFTDPELIGANDSQGRPATHVKAEHVNDLRLAVAGVRSAALVTTSWQEEVRSDDPIKAAHVRELRTKLDEALAALGLPLSAYVDTPLNGSPNATPIKKLHFEQLRERSTRGTGVTGSGFSSYDFPSARLDAANRTGGAGFDLYSRNFNWSLPVLSSPSSKPSDVVVKLAASSMKPQSRSAVSLKWRVRGNDAASSSVFRFFNFLDYVRPLRAGGGSDPRTSRRCSQTAVAGRQGQDEIILRKMRTVLRSAI